ncbi:hypothetical protein GQ53DRAFT_741135 [Thozetella sp. PMI_491]|nr:hypothetical protein GQ53DRAFT_741135 [Thozetella sp. PMI_491]
MPLRVKSRRPPEDDARAPSPVSTRIPLELPTIGTEDSFREVVKKISVFISSSITLPNTFEQLRTTSAGESLRHLVEHLGDECTNPAIVNALLALKWHYGAAPEDRGLNEARAFACEIVAWRFLTHLSEREAVDYCLYEIPEPEASNGSRYRDEEQGGSQSLDENSPLLAQAWNDSAELARKTVGHTGSSRRYQLLQSLSRLTMSMTGDQDDEEDTEEDPTAPFINLNALEIAAIANAKRFLSQNIVQKIITGIWNGDIIFWENLSVTSTKKPRFYNPKTADPYSRLRVPRYLKSFEVLFFATFLCLYYAVLVERNPYKISITEIFLYIWFGAFFYDELSEWIDAGSIFYAADVWNVFDIAMILIGIIFATFRIVGLSNHDSKMIDLAFDVLALEALFMVPRVCSILSLSPYWGTLIPCLKEMGKDFIKFMVLVVILYLGFLTTFSLVGRDSFTLRNMAWILTKIFYGSSYVGFDIMHDIDPIFGPPLMIIFVTLSSILLMGSLTGMLSNSFSRVITHAREEYLYVYSVYVLEASTSNRLTHFYPPFNLLALIIFRPLRLFLPSDNKFRAARIVLLKATHFPIVAVIQLYELVRGKLHNDEFAGFKGPRHNTIAGGSVRRPSRPAFAARPSSAYQPGPEARPNSAAEAAAARDRRRDVAEAALAAEEDDAVAVPSDTDVRIAELNTKIDRLTELVLALQAQHSSSIADVALS